MARLFQKYVTSEGRSEIPPEDEGLRTLSMGPRLGEEVKSKLGGSAVTMQDISLDGERKEEKEEGLNIESAVSMYLLMKGIRNMIQYFAEMNKAV